MVNIKEDLTGLEFERLTVLKRIEDRIMNNGQAKAQWLCECSCKEHNQIRVLGVDLKRKHTKSCGCLAREKAMEVGKSRHYINKYNLEGEHGIGFTKKNEQFWFDKEDYQLIKDYCWYYNKKGYVEAYDFDKDTHITLHRLIMGFPSAPLDVDHKTHPPRNEHKVDNRKANLEIVTKSHNSMNHVTLMNNTSGCSGVNWLKHLNKWRARIVVDHKEIHLGVFEDIQDAIEARRNAEIKYFGEHRYSANNSARQNDYVEIANNENERTDIRTSRLG